MVEDRIIHVVPINDLISHDTDTDQCVCGPSLELVEGEEGDGWLVVHHSLDGREADELDELEEADDDGGDSSDIEPGAGH